MNAETRAKEIMAWLRQECSDAICTHLDCPSCGCMAYLVQAIRQAENDKLEEAARVAENPGFIQARDTEWDMGVNYAKPFIANAIRALKKD